MVTTLCLTCLSVFIFCQALDMKTYFCQFLRPLVLFDSSSFDVVKPLGKFHWTILRCHSFPILPVTFRFIRLALARYDYIDIVQWTTGDAQRRATLRPLLLLRKFQD